MKDVTKKERIPGSKHFDTEFHDFKRQAKLITIEQLNQLNLENQRFEND